MQGAQIMELCAVAQACLALADRIERVYPANTGSGNAALSATRWHSMATWALEYVEQRYHDAADMLENAADAHNDAVARGLREGQPVQVRVARPPHRSPHRVAPAPPRITDTERVAPVMLSAAQRGAMTDVLDRVEDGF